MATITITCRKCENKIKVNITTIDNLRSENKKLKDEIRTLTAKIAALETMKNSGSDLYGDLLKDLFK